MDVLYFYKSSIFYIILEFINILEYFEKYNLYSIINIRYIII